MPAAQVDSNLTCLMFAAARRMMAAVGISFVIVPHTAQGTTDNSTAECPSGRFEAYFPIAGNEGLPAACFSQIGSTAPGGTIGVISRAAAEAGLGLHLGLAYPFTHLWMCGRIPRTQPASHPARQPPSHSAAAVARWH